MKYGIERTYDRSVAANGPTYYQALLTDPKYPGPYKDKSPAGLTAIDTPNATTLVFHLVAPFPDLPDVLAFPSSAPVLQSADTGSNYQLHPLSTGPYMFKNYTLNKQLTMVPNPQWNPATDPNAKQLASQIIVNLNVSQPDIDNRLIHGDIQVDSAGTGLAAAGRAQVLGNPTLKANSDNPVNGFARFIYLNTKVAPMNNLHCREAVEYAANKVTMQTAWGGPIAGGQIGSTIMPPNIMGYKSFDYYNALSQPTGDISAAKQQLAMCGHAERLHHRPGLPHRPGRRRSPPSPRCRPRWPRSGSRCTLKGFPAGSYYTDFAGAPAYVHSHDLGMAAGGWGADWPDGFGFLDSLVAGNTISATGNSNVSEENNPVINNLFTQSSKVTGAARTAIWSQIDEQAMKDAVILPMVYQKVLLYRPSNLTNVYVQAFYGMYNYAVMGVTS